MPAPVHVLLAVLAVGALKNAQAAPALVVPCEGLTGVDYCTECAKPAGAAKPFCYLCHPTRASIWRKDGTISECKAATTGVACTRATGDQNCAYCYGVTCMQCKPGYEADSNFKCQPLAWNTLAGCRALSKNPQCGVCTADGACTLCSNAAHILVPANALYINAPGQGSQCMTIAQMKAFAQTITGNPAVVPTGCKEVDTEFKCIRCANTHSLTGNPATCKTLATGSKCKTTLPYYQYCAQCDTAGTKCLSCNGSRSPPTGVTDGRCALPCKQLFGIGCLKCNQSKCLNTDAKYAQGRKALLLLLCLLACAETLRAAVVQPYCGALTGVAGCVECSATKLCYFCNYLSSPVWTSPGPKLTECRALSGACRGAGLIGGVTLDATFGKYCAACESKAAAKPFAANRCVRCLPSYGLDATNKCTLLLGTTGTGLDACRRTSMNAGCAECNPDGTCRRCTTAGAVLMPSAAIWLDAGYPETQCLVTTSIQTEAKKVVGTAGNVVAACAEVDLEFNCVACMQPTAANLFGWGPKVDATDATGKKIACVKNGGTTAAPIGANSGCLMKTPYMQYCKKCDATRTKCLAGQCMGGRSVGANGQCSLNCKGMFGISCTACTATACTALDATFKSGR